MKRREFLRALPASAGVLTAASTISVTACRRADNGVGPDPPRDPLSPVGPPLPIPPTLVPQGLSLQASIGVAELGEGRLSEMWLYDGSSPGPTLRATKGDEVQVFFENGLDEKSIVHWHGLDVPDHADGHPRWAVGPGGTYRYDFTVRNRAGTYWYHPHPHERTGIQTTLGMAGLFIVDDGDEAALGLPSGPRDVPLVIQDKRLGGSGEIVYAPTVFDSMVGYLGESPFVNGVSKPFLRVERGLYRFRILNGSNARIYDLALSNRQRLTLVGNDGGFLDRPESVERVLLAPGERVDTVVDFSTQSPGETILLQSLPFSVLGPPSTQGMAMDLLRFVVSDGDADPGTPPATLPPVPSLPVGTGARRQDFSFTSMMGRHVINGRSFEMDRVDARIPLGEAQIWRFTNTSPVPHPVHMHGGQFRVISRSGGRGRVFPWERGLKDTVLLLSFESVDVAVRFTEYRGLYLLHCHNLEHEDAGMMLNFEVV